DRMALMLAPAATGREGQFITIAHIGFAGQPPLLPRTSQAGGRLIAGHTLSLDDPLTQRRVDAHEIDFWREAGIHYFVPCVSKEGRSEERRVGKEGRSGWMTADIEKKRRW